MIKMLLFDLDDTLLNSERVITKRTTDAIKLASGQGILIGYITTRSPRLVMQLLGELPCDAVSYFNGAKTYCEGKLISHLGLSFKAGLKLITDCKDKFPDTRISAYFGPYSLQKDSIYMNGRPSGLQSIYDCDENEFQRIIINTKDPALNKFITADMKITGTRHGNSVVTHSQANKGNAAQQIGKYFSITCEEMVAFGDDINDIPMFRVCGTGVAMGNAICELKTAADYITEDHDNDGIAIWLEKHLRGLSI